MDITIKNLSKAFDEQLVLNDFTHTFKEGTTTCIMGKSGVGKTTLAKIIAAKTSSEFVTFSAVTSGIKEIKDVMQDAEKVTLLSVLITGRSLR